MVILIECLRCGQNKATTISISVCDECRTDNKEFAKETEEHRNEAKDPLTTS
jgi:hypothetical protein